MLTSSTQRLTVSAVVARALGGVPLRLSDRTRINVAIKLVGGAAK